jgi:hypothetical protein
MSASESRIFGDYIYNLIYFTDKFSAPVTHLHDLLTFFHETLDQYSIAYMKPKGGVPKLA